MRDYESQSAVLYLDLELTCWDTTPPNGMQPEIIEIGIVEMDLTTLSLTREQAYFVRPRRWEISEKCTRLTGITGEDVKSARPLDQVLALIAQQFAPLPRVCCAWGDDGAVLAAKCRAIGIESPFRRSVDLALLLQHLLVAPGQMSLTAAMEFFGLGFDGVPHGALPDSRNTARLHAAILRRLCGMPEPVAVTAPAPTQATLTAFGERLRSSLLTDKPPQTTTMNRER